LTQLASYDDETVVDIATDASDSIYVIGQSPDAHPNWEPGLGHMFVDYRSPNGALIRRTPIYTTQFIAGSGSYKGVANFLVQNGLVFLAAYMRNTADDQEIRGGVWVINAASGSGASDPAWDISDLYEADEDFWGGATISGLAITGTTQPSTTGSSTVQRVATKATVQPVLMDEKVTAET
jgi:hypothetical protein